MSVCASQPPLAYLKKSSPGLTEPSMPGASKPQSPNCGFSGAPMTAPAKADAPTSATNQRAARRLAGMHSSDEAAGEAQHSRLDKLPSEVGAEGFRPLRRSCPG